MFYIVSMILSLLCLAVTVIMALRNNRSYKRTRIFTPSRVLAVGVFLSSWCLLLPYYYLEVFSELSLIPRLWESIWVSVHHVIRFFVADVDFSDIQKASDASGFHLYYLIGTVLLVLAPLLTFSVVLSFFRNFASYRKYLMHPNAATYVFSELNEKSLNLASDLKRNHPSAMVIFTDVFEDNNEDSYELVERAKELGAICFEKDMLSINLFYHSKRSLLCFFAIAEERSVRGMYRQATTATTAEEENLKQAQLIVKHPFYANRPNTQLFVFASSTQGEILIDNLPQTQIEVRRVDPYSPLILRTLHDCGKELLFDGAVLNESGEREINVIVVGAGGYGSEMIRNLVWYCQMDGYKLSIDVFDGDPLAGERFAFTCPAILDEKNNGCFQEMGAPRYSIQFHNGIPVNTIGFTEALARIQSPTYVLVSLGSDELNVNTAITVRRLFRQAGCPVDPVIHTIVYDSENKQGLERATNHKNQHYDISYIGDLADAYSEAVIINEDLEKEALKTYNRFAATGGQKRMLPTQEYLRQTSTLEALYRELCAKLAYAPDENALEDAARREHTSWMARMYSLGYVYGKVRDDIAKTHPLLLPFHMLSVNEQNKLVDFVATIKTVPAKE